MYISRTQNVLNFDGGCGRPLSEFGRRSLEKIWAKGQRTEREGGRRGRDGCKTCCEGCMGSDARAVISLSMVIPRK